MIYVKGHSNLCVHYTINGTLIARNIFVTGM